MRKSAAGGGRLVEKMTDRVAWWRSGVYYLTVDIHKLLGIGPCSSTGFGPGLGVGVKEDDIGGNIGVLECFGDVFRLGQKIGGHVLDSRAALFGQKGHHLWGRWAT